MRLLIKILLHQLTDTIDTCSTVNFFVDFYIVASSFFRTCTTGVHSIKHRHLSSEWTILSHVNCFIQGEVIGFQILLDSLHPCSMRASWWSPPVLQGETIKIFLASVLCGISAMLLVWIKADFSTKTLSVVDLVCPATCVLTVMDAWVEDSEINCNGGSLTHLLPGQFFRRCNPRVGHYVLPRWQLVICCGAGVRLSYMYWMMSILVIGTWRCTLIDEITRQWQRTC